MQCRIVILFFFVIWLDSCAIPNDIDPPSDVCVDRLESNISIGEIQELATSSIVQILEEWIIEGYVTSSDHQGNFFNTLHFQEGYFEGACGWQVDLELRDSYLQYPLTSKVFIKLKGLYVGMNNGVLKMGGARSLFGALSVSRIPTLKIDEHLFLSCESQENEQALVSTFDSLQDQCVGTLVTFEQVEFPEDMQSLSYAEEREETYRDLVDCNGNKTFLVNSGYASFQPAILPKGNGSIRGILLKEGKDYLIKIRDTSDLIFDKIRCSELYPPTTSQNILISEIADPNNNSKARFVELFNSSNVDLSLKGWSLQRYTNANVEPSSTFDLTGSTISAMGTLLIAANDSVFRQVYGLTADLIAGGNSVANSNGDDNLVLLDPFNAVIDQFGIPGEDGSGTNHEFEDGGAFRKSSVTKGQPEYLFEEWTIYNDSGKEGTILKELNAPEDYSPGIR